MRELLVLLLFCGVAGCAGPGSGLTAFERDRLASRERGLATATARVRDPVTLARIAGLLARLDAAARLRVYVIAHPAPQAEVIGGEVLLVRTGLLEAVQGDDELAFVLAHEWAHAVLGHIAARRQATWNALAAEVAADAWAARALARAGMRATAGVALLGRLETMLPAEAREVVRARRAALAESAAPGAAEDLP